MDMLIIFYLVGFNFITKVSSNDEFFKNLEHEFSNQLSEMNSLSQEIENLNSKLETNQKMDKNFKKLEKNFSKCPKDYQSYANGKYCFHIKTKRSLSVFEEYQYCQAKSNGFLIENHYTAAFKYLKKYIKKTKYTYIGLTDLTNERKGSYGGWRWATNSKVFPENKKNWYAIPDNFRGIENCAIIDSKTGKFGDINCSVRYPHNVICEWTPERIISSTSNCAKDWVPVNVGKNPKTGWIQQSNEKTSLNHVSHATFKQCCESCTKSGRYCLSFFYSKKIHRCAPNFYVDTLLQKKYAKMKWQKYMRKGTF